MSSETPNPTSEGDVASQVIWPAYSPQEFEGQWQQRWELQGLYHAQQGGANKFYCLDFFPYPSGEGLHVGHCRNYLPTDVISRYRRMRGDEVLHPMGWDAFGEPAEQTAVAHGVHPRETIRRNSARFREQLTLIGNGYDWRREINSSDPRYYRWTQYFFLLLYRRGLAYRDNNWQWWCPVCATTLSSHEAAGGVCWRGHKGVYKREIPAWYFRITAYADELLDGLDELDWPEPVKAMQRNWIGRSEGVEVIFRTEDGQPVQVFTTRPDTLYGVTFFVLAPEHPLAAHLTTEAQREAVQAYQAQAARRSEVERMLADRDKTGVFTGAYVINPINAARVPVWVADYVLPGYGFGAVMGVPAHDQRDFEFARQFGLPLQVVIASPEYVGGELEAAYTEPGRMVDSGLFSGLPSEEGAEAIVEYLEGHEFGRRTVTYHMRDWLISRQHYWGTPIPIVYCSACGEVPLPEEQLPVLLPDMDDFLPDSSGRSPLARLPEFVHTECPQCGGPAERETDTMGGFACSSWYFLRFTSPDYDAGPFEPQAMQAWMPVDLYVGGEEHAVLHLLYARFWTRVLADAGLLPFREPFTRLRNQGQVMGPDGQRMSKSRGNVITPDSVVTEHGADALRVYALFVAPFEQDVNWNEDGINGAWRFLNRVWNLYAETYEESRSAAEQDPALARLLHQTIRDAGERIETLRFNTMISTLMAFTNTLGERQRDGNWRTVTFHRALESLMVLLAPVAPHIAEELWARTGHSGSVHRQPWPEWSPALARETQVELAVQVDGRLRAVIVVPRDAGEAEVRARALEERRVQQHLRERALRDSFYVPGRVINFVTGPEP